MKRKTTEYVAEYLHESAPVDHLSGVLDRYDQLSSRHAPPEEVAAIEERDEFVIEWTSRREDMLRGALEEVIWELEKRGHHGWLEDEGVEVVQDLVETGDSGRAAVRWLDFRFVEATETDHAGAPTLRFLPDLEACRVHADAWFGDPRVGEPLRIASDIRVALLSERLVVDLATEFVFDVLRLREPELRPPAPALPPGSEKHTTSVEDDALLSAPAAPTRTPERAATVREHSDEHPRQWSDPGILEHWVDQQRAARVEAAHPPDST